MDAVDRVERVRAVLAEAGVASGRAMVRHWWGGVLVDLCDAGDAARAAAALESDGWMVAAGPRAVIAWIDEPSKSG